MRSSRTNGMHFWVPFASSEVKPLLINRRPNGVWFGRTHKRSPLRTISPSTIFLGQQLGPPPEHMQTPSTRERINTHKTHAGGQGVRRLHICCLSTPYSIFASSCFPFSPSVSLLACCRRWPNQRPCLLANTSCLCAHSRFDGLPQPGVRPVAHIPTPLW